MDTLLCEGGDRVSAIMSARLHLEKDLLILQEHRHALSGARLILAREEKRGKINFITAWVAPWQRTIRDFTRHSSEDLAISCFEELKNADPPVTPSLKRDWQQGAVYKWEEKTIRRHDSDLSREHMKKIVSLVAKEFNLATVPEISARKKHLQWLADYNDETHSIRVHNGRWRLSYVLHEMAHAIDTKLNGNKWADHGPSFMRTLLAVIEKYKYWHDADDLEKSASASGLKIAATRELPHLPQTNAPV